MAERIDDPVTGQASEGELARQYAELEQFYRTSPVGLCLFDLEFRYVRINERLAEINGLPVEDHIGRSISEVLPEIGEVVEPLFRRVLANGEPLIDVPLTCTVPSDPDNLRHWMVSSYPFDNAAGERIGVSVVVTEVTEVHRARDILEVSEARYRALVEQAPEAIVVLDVDTGHFVDMNRNALQLFGLDRERMIEVGPLELSPERQPDGRRSADISRDHRAAAIDGEELTFHWTHRHADGHLFPCEVRLSRLPTEGRRLLRGSILDISERVRAEQALQMSEARYRSLVEHAADAICVLDAETGLFVDYNENTLKLFGMSRERFLQAGPADVSPECQPNGRRSYEMARALVGEALRTGGVVSFEWTHRRTDGTLVPCEIRLLRLPGDDRKLVHATLVDITERKEEELARRRNENRLRLLVESTDAVPWEADPETWMFTYVGPQAERLLGFPLRKWFESGFWESRIHPEDCDATLRFCRDSAARCDNYSFEYRMITARDEIIWIHDLVSVERGTAEAPARLRGFMLDVTARKRAELLQTGQRRVLEKLARGEPLADVLCELARTLDDRQAAMKCSILLLDEEGRRLRHGAAPGLPEEYNRRVDGLEIGPAAGSCGTAAFRRERVVVSDVMTDPLWKDYRELARTFDLRACWSQPIMSKSGDVLGTFAIYHRHSEMPTPAELEVIEQAAYLAGVAIERQRSDAALRASESALRRSQTDLQHLAGRLITAQEEERRRLSRDLHDDLTQRLAVLAIEAGKLEKRSAEPAGALREGLRAMRDDLVNLSADVHDLSRQLHPAVLEDLGLVDALESECARFSEREGIKTTFSATGVPCDLPRDVALCFYRAAQESLRNIGKHSGARNAQVELSAGDGAMRMSIKDDGGGFDPVRSSRRGGVGLASMSERIRLVDGSLAVRSRAGQGTTILVRVPLTDHAAAEARTSRIPPAPVTSAPEPHSPAPRRTARRKTRARRPATRTAPAKRRHPPATT